jgi:hypothetical protein
MRLISAALFFVLALLVTQSVMAQDNGRPLSTSRDAFTLTSEWILISTFTINEKGSGMRDLQPIVIGGFSRREFCESAGGKISVELIGMTGDHSRQQGVAMGSFKMPSVFSRCILIMK